MIKCRGIPKHRKNRTFRRASKNFATPQIHLRKFRNPKSHLRKFRNTIPTLRKFHNPISDLRIPMVFSGKPTVSRKAKILLKKSYLKTSTTSIYFARPILYCKKLSATLRSRFLSIPHPTATNLKKRPLSLASFQPWCASEEAI